MGRLYGTLLCSCRTRADPVRRGRKRRTCRFEGGDPEGGAPRSGGGPLQGLYGPQVEGGPRRRHGVNPFSGCAPMCLQIPIFVGLYNALLHAIELRHAPFALWITDLSAPERLFVAGIGIPVMTIIMGGTMLVQQWLTPQQGDPTQRQM